MVVAIGACDRRDAEAPDQTTAGATETSEAPRSGSEDSEALVAAVDATFEEHSRDSSTKKWSIRIDGDEVTYSGPIEPLERGQWKHGEAEFTLTEDQRTALLRELRGDALSENVDETKSLEVSGPHRSVELQARIRIGDDVLRKVRIVGPYGMGGEARERALSDEAQKAAGAVRGVCEMVREFARQ